MRSPSSQPSLDDSAAKPGVGRRAMRSLRRLPAMGRVLLALVLAGAAWFVWDIATDDSAALTGDRFERIDQFVADQLNDARIPGASLAIVEEGTVAHSSGFGNDGDGNRTTPDTPFWIGSNTKSITALAIMQLDEAGVIDLDAPVRKYLPEFRVADAAASGQITVRHLLNQTSGISRHDGIEAVAEADESESITDVVTDMADLDLNRPVGERFEYSNLNAVVLGAVIETATGESWQDYVQANIFDPLAMADTYTDQDAADANGLTATHRTFFGFPIKTDARHYPSLAPSGYVYASANDMARYLTMYLEGGTLDGQRVLSDSGIAEMLTSATNERTFQLQSQEFTASYGAGWFIGPFGAADDARWHQGSLPHFTTWIVLLPDTNQAVVVMLNAGNQFEIGGANAAWSRIPQGVVDLLRDADPPTGPSTTRFFIVFATVVALAVVAQAWTLTRVLLHRRRMPSRRRGVAPLAWELVVAPLMLIGYPAVAGGLGWSAAFAFVPDLSLAVATVAGLAVLTGLARLARHVRTFPAGEMTPDSTPDPQEPAGSPGSVTADTSGASSLDGQHQ